MKTSLLLTATLFACLALPVRAQISIPAPTGWKIQTRDGARTFVPPDLKVGEIYSLTVYDSAPMNGQTLEEFLRESAGKVGKGVGQLAFPLKVQITGGRAIMGLGGYNGPQGTQILVLWEGFSVDGGKNIHLARTLSSVQGGLLDRYQNPKTVLLEALVKRAIAEAGDNIERTPSAVSQKFVTIGGPLAPGVYAGNQFRAQELLRRLRVYIYTTGEYRVCNENDEDLGDGKTGEISYNRNSGKLSIDRFLDLGNSGDDQFCYFGRDQSGKPAIYAEDEGFGTTRTTLTWVAQPLKRLSKTQEDEQKAELEAIKNRFKWTVAPGKGVQNAQIATVLLESKFNGESADETVYLLLKDGTVYADLPVAPDELDIIRSRQKEPDKWGKWRKTPAGYKVSWAGAPFQDLPGSPVVASAAQQKLAGRWGTGRASNNIIVSSYALWGVTFSKTGRFKKDSRGGSSSSIGFGDLATNTFSTYDDEGSVVSGSGPNHVFSSEQKKKNPNGSREGDYSLNGYVLTLRFDNGKVKRLPFFFGDNSHKTIWFEGASMSKGDK